MLKAAFIGAGGRSQGAHYPNVHRLQEDVDMLAVCDMDEARLDQVAKKYEFPHVFTDHRKMLDDVDLDIVYCVMNEKWLLQPALDCINAGKHIFIEKPPGANSDQTQQLLEAAEANYDLTVANYRQTVLDSFREVEDNLVQLRVLAAEAVVQRQALEAAQESLRLIQNQYRAGTVDFLSVATVQTSALNNERTYLTLLGDQLAASVQLIAALGGGWEEAQLDFEPVLETSER